MWRTIQRITTIIRQASPYIAGLLWVMLVSSAMCIKFFSKGVNEECEKVALEWTRRTVTEREGLSLYEAELLSIYAFLAWLSVLMGWIILSHITVIAWRWLWRFLII
jgi:hypothetical protein